MKLVALLRIINEQKTTEAFGGRPVGDPNSQDASGGPEYLTPGGQEGVPTDEPEKEFKPEDFETKISRRLHRKAMKGRDEKTFEVDHPEYMPDEGPARYDPAYDYPNVDQRQPGFNTGFPSP